MNIIKTDIVSAEYDIYWTDISFAVAEASQKSVLIIVADCAETSTEDLQLQKMLEASKLQNSQFIIVRLLNGQKISWHQLREKINPKIILTIVFGYLPYP